MKVTRVLAIATLLILVSTFSSHATTGGFVFCDSNGNGQFDTGDVPLTGVLVVVTNTSGTFSNAAWTITPEGGFAIALGSTTDTYVEFIHPATLPTDATVVLPAGGVYTFTLAPNNTEFLGNFLVTSSTCTTNNPPPPPPPPPTVTNFCLKAAGTICGPGKTRIVFNGSVSPACDGTNADTGEWDVCFRPARIRFQGSVVDITAAGEDQNTSGATFRYIEFQGGGTISGIEGCKIKTTGVFFHGRAEDHGGCHNATDELYLRIFTAEGTTLLLISGDTADASDISPVPITGDLVISTNCCPCTRPSGHGNDEGKDHPGDHRGRNGNDNGNCTPGGDGHSGGSNGNHQGNDNGNHNGQGNGNGNHTGGGNDSGHGDRQGGGIDKSKCPPASPPKQPQGKGGNKNPSRRG